MESGSSVNLDVLPVEILQTIARHSSGEAAVSLSQVSRRLRSVCYDCFVFKSNIAARGPRSTRDGRLVFLDELSRQIGSDTDLWARYAVANSRVADLGDRFAASSEYPDWTVRIVRRFASCAPHLVVLKRE